LTEHRTISLCPVCLRRIPAKLKTRGKTVSMVKSCPEHGSFSVPIWQGPPDFSAWTRPKTPYSGGERQTKVSDGCPYDCGLCPDHHQRTCTVLVEVTQDCNLRCPICFADSGKKDNEPDIDSLAARFRQIIATTGGCNLQLSGGEPTVRDDLPQIVAAARDAGFSFIQLNTNGLRLAADPHFTKKLKEAGLTSVFLQFDSLNDDSWQRIRGRRLCEQKLQAVELLAELDLGIVLVATIVRGINDSELWNLCQFGLDHQPAVRGIHFQPVSLFGRFPNLAADSHITLPELMQGLVEQSGDQLHIGDFLPPGCEHALCSFSARYLNYGQGRLTRLGATGCNCTPQPAEKGALQSISWTAQQWATPVSIPGKEPKDDLDLFLARARTHTFSLSAMAFQDCWNIDLERLQGCCIHVSTESGRLIPFCAYNLTSQDGTALYRGKV